MAATDQTCRVSIRTTDREADVELPAQIPIGELMPALVDLLGADQFGGGDPHLTRVCGGRLDPAATLARYAIPDGELLILATEVRPLPITRVDPSDIVEGEITAMAQPMWRLTRSTAGWCALGWVAAVLLVFLGQPILDPEARRHPVIGALAALLMLAGAVAVHRGAPTRAGAVSLGVLAAAFAGVTAALAHPGRPGMPAFLLAMAGIASASMFAWRILSCAPSVFVSIAATAMACSSATVGAVMGWWPTATVGPMLAAASLAVLAVSARLAVHSSGLARAGLADVDLAARARAAHRRLAVVVVSAAATAALGAALTAVTTAYPVIAGTFIAIVAADLLIRASRQVGSYAVAAQMISAAVAVTVLVGLCIAEWPPSAPWLCGVLLLIAAGAIGVAQRTPGRPSAAMSRAISALELLLGAAIVPAAVAAAGAFGGLTQIGLPR
ncbi:type VII secretion integral membrane protein EccD [Mycobacterium sp. EPa45]|uniref:type VII secretion integral membrane protein EccD n=1 Tax=Mycobacterium sp. EPa45 TaxID=1545728 RepID=UPI0006426AAE|nr:type VII secretion integral membrane protein EccD [Mycobacterium sp. EPa45]AKK29126.1 hypothetical protein AB431_23365 [Mycobacterium sp. EPa45]